MPTAAIEGNGHIAEQDWEHDEAIKAALKDVYAPKATDAQFLVFLNECKRRNAQPGRHIHFRLQRNKEREWDEVLHQSTEKWVAKPVFITSIDFFRLTAHRSGRYAGQKPLAWYYRRGAEAEAQLVRNTIPRASVAPYCAEATVLRKDFDEPMVRVARWDAYKQTYKDGKMLTPMWARMGPEMLAKCAEAAALRAAFPEELGGLYIREEFNAEDAPAEHVDEPTHERPELPEPSAAPFDPQVSPGKARPAGAESPSSYSAPVASPLKDEAAARPAGRDGIKWYIREVLDRAGMKKAGYRMQDYVRAATGVADTSAVTEAQFNTLLAVLDGVLRSKGPGAVVELIESGLASR